MSDVEEDLKALSQDLAADASRVVEIEQEKATLDARDPRVLELARETSRLTDAMKAKGDAEVELAEDAAE
jgi:hypothetical protein